MKNQIWLSGVAASLLLIGCGGGSSTTASPTNTSVKTGTGFYVDAAIEGVEYSCGSQEGKTDSQGEFTFEKDKGCTFKIGNVLLRELNATSLEDNLTVFEDNTEVARLLQTLDSDGNASNGIEVLPETTDVLKERDITTVPKNEALLVGIKDGLKAKRPNAYSGNVVSTSQTQSHLNETSQRLTREGRRTQYGLNNGSDSSNSSGLGNNSNMGGNNSNMDGNNSNMGGNNSNMDGNNSNMGGNNSNMGGNNSNMGGNNSNMGGNNSNMGGNNSNMGGNNSNMGDNNSNMDGNNSNMGGNNSNMGGNNSNMGGNNSNMGGNNSNMNVTSTTLKNFNYVPYSKPLAIPALASYTIDADGYKVFNLDINQSTTEFFQGVKTVTYGINQNILGQTIRMHNGDKIKLAYTNNLSVATTIHGHGMHVPSMMDGGPMNKIQPGTTWTAQYTANQRACTNWYHPHFMHKTAEHVYMGLAGLIIIDDTEMDALDLPKEYGVDDIPLVLQDKRFDSAGQIDYSPTNMEVKMGYKSDIMLANGVINPYFDAPAKKVRFRVLNGSNARVYNLKFKNGKTFQQVGVDNSLLEKPVTLSSVQLSPAERAEIVVDFSQDLGSDFTLVDGNSNLEIMQVKVNSSTTKTSTIPDTLTTLTKLDETSAVRTRKFVLNMARGDDGAMHMAINGKLMAMARIDEVVPKDDIEVWEITNMMGMTHNFHIHATHFFPLTRNGVAVDANEQGYKDVIRMPGKSTVRVVVKMTDYVDDNIGYMYHCHFLEHEDDGMMGQFTVTDGAAVVNVGATSGSTGNGMNGMNGNSNQNQGNGRR